MNKIVIGIAAAGLLAACGGAPPTSQWLVNTDGQASVVAGPGGQCDQAQPGTDTKTTTYKDDALLNIYEQGDSTVFAEFGSHVYSGKKTGDSYSLTAINSTNDQSNANATLLQSDVWTLTLKVDGNYVSGQVVDETHESCTGSNCGNQPTVDCISTKPLRGTKLPDDGTVATRPQVGG